MRRTLSVPGIHHVTAIAGPAQQNVDFYADLLGLRTVKQTVNFDDPGTYHLYYGDQAGTPGTAMTFFPWEHAARGGPGSGVTEATGFSVLPGSLEFWADRLGAAGASPGEVATRFDEESLRCEDPDGLVFELVAGPATRETPAGLSILMFPRSLPFVPFTGCFSMWWTRTQRRSSSRTSWASSTSGSTAGGSVSGAVRKR